ncbi:YfeC-like transcriptional regulator [Scandinavium goeteborgense]|uniref:YfeC-like transcriptional regulator n=1 Tax=Scandinavium goeteborgense TaxID=1851514 RepID=UPI000D7C1298|nr:YfeC-like transcriptional regulator [Scandinavium goeteborgense]MCS2155221.1 putative DNA-binding transcriptional regulator [Scandinavium goeteborgense]
MNILHSKMTTQELANCVGVAKQTINRWIREQDWTTESIPGVKGGRARLIHITPEVRDYLATTPKLRHLKLSLQAAEPEYLYHAQDNDPVWRKIQDVLVMMEPDEKQRLQALLVREGLSGFLRRLNIADESA